MAALAERTTITEQNAALRQQLSPQNQAYWDELVSKLRQQPKFADEAVLQKYLRELLPSLLVAQSAQQTAQQFYGADPATVAVKMGRVARAKPSWLTWDLLVPLLIFTLGTIIPSAILPAVPFQLLLVGLEYGFFVIAMALGIGVTQRIHTPRGQIASWLVIIIALLLAMRVAAQTVPAQGLVYLTRVGGSITLLVFAIVVTGLTWWHHRRHANSWFPAILGSLWITTLLALLARMPATSGLMVTSAGNLLIALGTILGDLSILIIGWHIWQARKNQTK
nr:hypothetical protein [Levilactobacillus enshiensis]